MLQTVCYEHPLNEKMRLFLRIELQFQQVAQNMAGQSEGSGHAALLGLLGILNLTSRNELKGELLKELERHSAFLNGLRETPGVDASTLDSILTEIGRTIENVHQLDNQAVERVQRNDFLVAVRQRGIVPGSLCAFDLPALHHWLQQDKQVRAGHLENWLGPFEPMRMAVGLILQLIRGSAVPTEEVAAQGIFHKVLDGSSPSQLVRVILPAGGGIFPEISASRHRFSIRFMEQPDPNNRAQASHEDVNFWLACCVI